MDCLLLDDDAALPFCAVAVFTVPVDVALADLGAVPALPDTCTVRLTGRSLAVARSSAAWMFGGTMIEAAIASKAAARVSPYVVRISSPSGFRHEFPAVEEHASARDLKISGCSVYFGCQIGTG